MEGIPPVFDREPQELLRVDGMEIPVFVARSPGLDERLLQGFAREWERFATFDAQELDLLARELFDLLPSDRLGANARVIDIGCGSGRWSRWLSAFTGHIHAIDPSNAIISAAKANTDKRNLSWAQARGEDLPFQGGAFDMALCIGVLHHMDRPGQALKEAFRVLRPGGLLYFYIYYALEDRSLLFKGLYRISDLFRRMIHPLPFPLRYGISQMLAMLVYLPLVTAARCMKWLGLRSWHRMPLSFYHNKSFRIMRNDALDRFGTPVEERFTKAQIKRMLEGVGFSGVRFSEQAPYWHGSAVK